MEAIDKTTDRYHNSQVILDCKAICGRCPVRDDCLEWALGVYGPQFGVLGGLDGDEREAILRGSARLRRQR